MILNVDYALKLSNYRSLKRYICRSLPLKLRKFIHIKGRDRQGNI